MSRHDEPDVPALGAAEPGALQAGLYEQALAAAAGAPMTPQRPPRASAAVVPWRRRDGRLEVFWVRRSETVPFMPGWHAFPGGAVSRGDGELPLRGAPRGVPASFAGTATVPLGSQLAGEELGPDLSPGVVAAALRELWEETGLLLAAPAEAGPRSAVAGGNAPAAGDDAETRAAGSASDAPRSLPVAAAAAGPSPAGVAGELTAGRDDASVARELAPGVDDAAVARELTPGLDDAAVARGLTPGLDSAALAAALRQRSLALDATLLTWAGRWLTPPFAPLRFDNRFFLLHWPAAQPQQPAVVPGELAEGEWIEPAAALARWRSGDVLAAPPILHVLTVLAEDGPEAGLPRLDDPAEADLGPFRRIELRPGVVMVPLRTPTLPPATHTNAYLLGTGPAVLVDPGSPFGDEQERLHAAVAAAATRLGRQATAIWLTHHHPDHVGGVAAAAKALGVPVAAHPATAERLAARGIRVDATLEDGERHELGTGFHVRVVHTPGHARGHLSFLVEEDGTLLCGDLLSALSTIVIDPPDGSMGDYLASLARAAALAPRFLFPAHGPVLRDGAHVLAQLVEHRRHREARILAAWRQGVHDPAAIVPLAYDADEVPPPLRPVAARQVLAHLDHLRQQRLL